MNFLYSSEDHRIITHWILLDFDYYMKYVKLKKVNCSDIEISKKWETTPRYIFIARCFFYRKKKKGKKNQNIYIIFFIILSENSINASSFMHVDYYPDTIFTWKITNIIFFYTLLCIQLDNNLEQKNECFYIKINVES